MKLHNLKVDKRIVEANKQDINAFETAVALYREVVLFIKACIEHEHDPFKSEIYDGEVYFILDSKKISALPSEYHDILFLFRELEHEDNSAEFALAKDKSNTKYIVLNIDKQQNETTAEAVYRTLLRTPISKSFIHEVTHYLDDKRLKSREYAYQETDIDDLKGYYNSPAEYNAYFKNLFHDLLAFLVKKRHYGEDEIEAERLRAWGYQNIPKDFYDYMKSVLMRNSNPDDARLLDFFKALQPNRKKALFKRAYRLHQEAIEYIY